MLILHLDGYDMESLYMLEDNTSSILARITANPQASTLHLLAAYYGELLEFG